MVGLVVPSLSCPANPGAREEFRESRTEVRFGPCQAASRPVYEPIAGRLAVLQDANCYAGETKNRVRPLRDHWKHAG
jgi:hypothetical protein